MALIPEDEADKFVKYAYRGRALQKKLSDLSEMKDLSDRDILIKNEIEDRLQEIDTWFRNTAKYD